MFMPVDSSLGLVQIHVFAHVDPSGGEKTCFLEATLAPIIGFAERGGENMAVYLDFENGIVGSGSL